MDWQAGLAHEVRCLQDRANVGVVAVGGIETGELSSLAGGDRFIWAFVGVGNGVRVEVFEGGEVVLAEGGDEGLEEGAEVVVCLGVVGDERGAFVGVEARKNGDAEVPALAPGGDGEVGN